MNDKQQLQMLGEHQAEQSLCMAKQVESLRQQVLERNDWLVTMARAAAGMQPDCDLSGAPEYVTTALSRIAEKHAAQLEAANRKIAVMAELLREVRQYPASDNNWGRGFGFLERIDAALAGKLPEQHPDDAAVDRFAIAMKAKLAAARKKGRGGWDDPEACPVEFLADLLLGHVGKGNPGNFEDIANLAMMLHQRGADPAVLAGKLPDHVAGAGKMVPEGWQLVRVEYANDVAETVIEDHIVTEWNQRWQEISGYRCGYCSLSGATEDDVINGEHDHDCVITKARSMLAAAPYHEQPDTAWTDAPAPEPTPQDYRELQERHDRLLSEHKAAVDALRGCGLPVQDYAIGLEAVAIAHDLRAAAAGKPVPAALTTDDLRAVVAALGGTVHDRPLD